MKIKASIIANPKSSFLKSHRVCLSLDNGGLQQNLALTVEEARSLRDSLNGVLAQPEVEDGPSLWIWTWSEGGYNNTYAFTEEEARQHADKIWPGHKIVDLKRLDRIQAAEYWRNLPMWD